MFDLDTILKAAQLVGEATDAGKAIYEGFIAVTDGSDQATLKERYAAARKQSDAVHDELQDEVGG